MDFDGNKFIIDFYFDNEYPDWWDNFDVMDGIIYIRMKKNGFFEKLLRINAKTHTYSVMNRFSERNENTFTISGPIIVHESRQPNTTVKCLNAVCSLLCLPINSTDCRCFSKELNTESGDEKVFNFYIIRIIIIINKNIRKKFSRFKI
jgi:hypothetical protein